MRSSKVSVAIRHYFKNTTLHGFKYLCSVHSVDRIGWLVCCVASACCAGWLCAVLWARFLQVPALLAVSDDVRTPTYVKDSVPTVAVCPPPESVADSLLEKLSINTSQAKQIPKTLARLLTGQSTAKDQLVLLDEILTAHNVTLTQVMMNFTQGCDAYTKRCRYQKKALPCGQLFTKELTYWGMCCVMRANKLPNVRSGLLAQPHSTQIVELVLQCTHGSVLYGCQFVSYYRGQEWVEPETLFAGYYYMAQLRFTTILENQSSNSHSLVEDACVHDRNYSRVICMRRCAENACGCRDPLQFQYRSTRTELPLCPAARLACLRASEFKRENACGCRDPLQFQYRSTRTELPLCPAARLACLRASEFKRENACGCRDPLQFQYRSTRTELPLCPAARLACLRASEFKRDNVSCHCLPSCKKITTYLVLEPSPMTDIKHAIDPLYYGLNITPSIVVTMRVNVGHSRVFLLNPTETWLTLLSSLGGVFNMFLGVGLFSALEFLYFLLAKLPVAIRKSSEIDPTATRSRYTNTTSRHVR
ncbi:hypothetical protein PYW07_015700 [Mythimna separata]|uniref:Sodium channel protein Nach n=1 Tax=Mythimna separata TaxID=271217 RepID=A0AAD7YQZ0_MYTSE|nr:hypothetical protein PYW07_015700 [Mythimna separata]